MELVDHWLLDRGRADEEPAGASGDSNSARDVSAKPDGCGGVRTQASGCGPMTTALRFPASLLGRHPDAAVETDDLGVQITVGGDPGHQLPELGRVAQPHGEDDRLTQRIARLVAQHGQQGRVEQAGVGRLLISWSGATDMASVQFV